MRPLDPRLLHHARATRGYLLCTTGLGLLTAALVVGQAFLLADVIAGVAMDGEHLPDVRTPLIALGLIVLARAAVAGAQERFGHRAATAVIRQLRHLLLERVVVQVGRSVGTSKIETADVETLDVEAAERTEPREPGDAETPSAETPAAETDAASIALLATRGLDNLDGYLTRYLPQLLLASTLTPAVLVVIWWQDSIAGWTVALTLPLIPLFMALVGLSTQAAADRSLRTLQRLGAQVLDLIAGLPTLRAFGRTEGPARRVRQVGEAHRRATMRTLRSAFLSALVLETLTTLSVALVAVGIGLRLVSGGLDLRTGLTVLLLAPEVYLPLRQVGVHFHASVDGLAAAAQVLTILDQPLPAPGTRGAPDLRTSAIRFEGLRIVHSGTDRATPDGLDAEVRPGEILALTGPSGAGKSSAVSALLGLRRADGGRIVIQPLPVSHPDQVAVDLAAVDLDGVDLAEVDPATWWAQLAWVPQHPALVPGTLAENVRLTVPLATQTAIDDAARITGLDAVVAAIPGGWSARVGQGGIGLSAGQRQRLALTRVLLSPAPLVILDEPTAHLDAGAEQAVLAVLATLREAGRSVVLIAHRPALAALADRVVVVRDSEVRDIESIAELVA